MANSFLSKTWLKVVAALALLVAIVLVGTPFLLQQLFKDWLLENGGDKVTVQDIDFNPFLGTLQLEGIQVQVDQERTLAYDNASLDLEWLPLFEKRVVVQSVVLRGLEMRVDNSDDLLLILGGIRINKGTGEAPDPQSETAPSEWAASIQTLTLEDIDLVYKDKNVDITTAIDSLQLRELTQWSPNQPAQLEISGSINNAALSLNAELLPYAEQPSYKGNIEVDQFALDALSSYVKDVFSEFSGVVSLLIEFDIEQDQQILKIRHQGKASLNELALINPDDQIREKKLSWNGSGDTQINLQTSALKTDTKGKLVSLKLGVGISDPPIEVSYDELTWDGSLAVNKDNQALTVQHQGKGSISELALTSAADKIREKSLSWDGSGNTEINLESSALNTKVKGKLVSDKLDVEHADPPVEVAYDKLTWQGDLALATGGPEPQIEIRADGLIQGLDFTAKTRKLRLGSAASLEIASLVVQGTDKINIDQVNVNDLIVGQQVLEATDGARPAVAKTDRLQIDKISYSDNVLAIDTIDEQSVISRVVRGKDGKLNMVRIMDLVNHLSDPVDEDAQKPAEAESAKASKPAAAQTAVADATGTAEPTDPLRIIIKQFKATGDSKIHFLDQSVDPEFDMVLDFQKAEMNNINTAEPDQPTTLTLEAKSGKYTALKANGMIKPFLDTPEMDIKADLKAMELLPLTPYTQNSLGLDMKSGTLDIDVVVKTVNQTMDGNVVLKLHQFEVASVDVENSLQSQIPLPLNVALDALRDRNNMIKLEIPIKGDPNNPDFNFNDAVRQALSKGVSKGAMAYLTVALQPYGAMIAVAKYAGEEVAKVRLKPTEFEPGESELDKTDRDYLGKVAKILHDRPKVSVKLCGVSVDKDLAVFRKQQADKSSAGKQQSGKDQKDSSAKAAAPASGEPTAEEKKYLQALATQRSTVVKDYLVEKHKSDASHLVGCQPKLQLGITKEQPRTDLLI